MIGNLCKAMGAAITAVILSVCFAVYPAMAVGNVQTVSVEIPPLELVPPECVDINVQIEGQGCVLYSQKNADPGKLLDGMDAIVKTDAPVDFEFVPEYRGNGWHIAQVVYNGTDMTELAVSDEWNRIQMNAQQDGTLYVRYEENVPEEPQDALPKTEDKMNILSILVPIVVGGALICVAAVAIIIHNNVHND